MLLGNIKREHKTLMDQLYLILESGISDEYSLLLFKTISDVSLLYLFTWFSYKKLYTETTFGHFQVVWFQFIKLGSLRKQCTSKYNFLC